MHRISRARLVLVCGVFVGLAALTALRADDPPPRAADLGKDAEDAVRKGLAFLAGQQHKDGGWGQAGGWRFNTKLPKNLKGPIIFTPGGLVPYDPRGKIRSPFDMKPPPDPSDVGNTAIALLALVRAGNTPTQGPYAKNVARAAEFIRLKIEKADLQSPFVTDVRDTQLQSKIGTYVDTFLAVLALAELKGKMPNPWGEQLLGAALNKTIAKIVKHQNDKGLFTGNGGWASVLSQSLANKGLNRARQVGVRVSDDALKRAEKQASAFDFKALELRPAAAERGKEPGAVAAGPGPAVRAGFGTGSVPAFQPAPFVRPKALHGLAGLTTAGVSLYAASASLANLNDAVLTKRLGANRAEEMLARTDVSPGERQKAEATLRDLAEAEKARDAAARAVAKELDRPEFIAGFGSNGGEEFLSFLNISEALRAQGGDAWLRWRTTVADLVTRAQDKDGSWAGHHCIVGKTFCTSAALLVLLVDRAPAGTSEKEKNPR
jgi:hypothetical protein